MKNFAKKAMSMLLALVMVVGMLPMLSVGAAAAVLINNSYDQDWHYWSHGGTKFHAMKMHTSGCHVVAEAKMLVDMGIASSDVTKFNPDVYLEWTYNNPYGKDKNGKDMCYFCVDKDKYAVGENVRENSNEGPVAYAKTKSVNVEYELKSNVTEKNIKEWIEAGYYVIVGCDAHEAYVSMSDEKGDATSDVIVWNSQKDVLNKDKHYQWIFKKDSSGNYVLKDGKKQVEAINFDKIEAGNCIQYLKRSYSTYTSFKWTYAKLYKKSCKSHVYNIGVCKTCGAEYDFSGSKNTGDAGKYEVTTGRNIYTKPYSDATTVKSIKQGDKLTVQYSVINAWGNKWYYVGNGYINENNIKKLPEEAPSSISFTIPLSNISVVQDTCGSIAGSIASKYPIEKLEYILDSKSIGSCSPKKTNVALTETNLSEKVFNRTLSAGAHTLVIKATDSKGVSNSSSTVTITIKSPEKPICATPKITQEDINGGKKVTITQSQAGATMTYFIDDNEYFTEKSSESVVLRDTAYISAYSEKSGMTRSAAVSKTVTVNKLTTPAINVSYRADGALVTFGSSENAQTQYSLDGSNFTDVTGALKISENSTVYAKSIRKGYADSSINSQKIEFRAPYTPSVSAIGKTTLAQGDPVSVRWNSDTMAEKYVLHVYDEDGVEISSMGTETTQTVASINLIEAGKYRITVQAVNSTFGSSAESAPIEATSMPPCKVTFMRWNPDEDLTKPGTSSEYETQLVKYGESAIRPTAPSVRGYTFDGWDGQYTNVYSDINIKATYTRNIYTVKFYAADGVTLLGTKYIGFGEPINAEKEEMAAAAALNDAYEFVDWRIEKADSDSEFNYNWVDSNMTLVAVSRWKNPDLPVIADLESAIIRNDSIMGYDLTIQLTTAPEKELAENTRNIKIIAAAKSAEDKLLDIQVITENVDAKTFDRTVTMFLPCHNTIADHVEINVLGVTDNDRTGTTLAKQVSAVPTFGSQSSFWSPWYTADALQQKVSSGELTQEGYDAIIAGASGESKTQYRYRDNRKENHSVTNNSSIAPTLEGWTYDKTSSSYGSWTDSGWTSAVCTETETVRKTNERVITDDPAYTIYNYYHWWRIKDSGATNNSYAKNASNSKKETVSSKTPFEYYKTYDTNYPAYKKEISGMHGYLWWIESTTSVPAKTHKEYFYQTRSKSYIHSFYKWVDGTWSTWGDTPIAAIQNSRDVETQKVYRYLTYIVDEDTSGTPRTISGNLPDSLGDCEGRVATFLIYKELNSDPAQSQIEYVGQTTIGYDNSYSINMKLKEEPSEEITGKFIVSVALEGTTNLLNVKYLTDESTQYEVKFLSRDGELLRTQYVSRFCDAEPPEAPEIDGCIFMGWSGCTTNIQRNQEFFAQYFEKPCTVVYVDWLIQTADMFEYSKGDYYSLPQVREQEGYTFLGWKILGTEEYLTDVDTVSKSCIIIADYEVNEYTVNFHGDDDTIIDSQTVKYGECAELPDGPSVDNKTFLGWNTADEWWNVRSDLDVYPIMVYNETAAMPESNVGTECFGEKAEIELTAEDGSTILYTIDGSDPVMEGEVYTDKIILSESAIVRAIASAPGKNDSDILEIYFDYYDGAESAEIIEDFVPLGTYNISAQPGSETSISLRMDDAPGLLGFMFSIECDTNVFYIDCDEDGHPECEAGSAFDSGTILCAPHNGKGWKVFWFSTEVAENAGNMFSLTLKVSEEAEPGIYPVKVSYSPSNTITAEDYLEDSEMLNVVVSGDGGMLGDLNGDGRLTNADVIFLLRHVVGLETVADVTLADTNRDGVITVVDALHLARYVVGLDEVL